MVEITVSAFGSELELICTHAVALCYVQKSHRKYREEKHDHAKAVTSILHQIDSD
jgi:hypothetical protein